MNLDDVKISDMNLGHALRVIREVAAVGVFSYFAIRIFSGDLSLDFTKLSPSELVSILLAFFSISLAAAFYFAATNASNKFYDNINKFNKDTSELLGRLDEQIKHVNTRQKELGDRIDRNYLPKSESVDEKTSQENEEQIAEVQAKWQESLQKILDSAKIEPEEKFKLESELRTKDEELKILREEQAKIEARKILQLKSYVSRKVELFGLTEAATYAPDELLFLVVSKCIPPIKRDLYKYGYIKSEYPQSPAEITNKGIDFISSIVSRMLGNQS